MSPSNTPADPVAYGERGMVATVHPRATQAAVEAMRRGGNAIDATIAAALMLGVVDGHNSGIGGGCFILIRRADGDVVAIDGRETAPGAATREMYLRQGKAQPELSQTGPLAVGVPGALAAYAHAAKHFGRQSLAEHLVAAAKVAEEGFRLDGQYSRRLAETATEIRQFEATRATFLQPNGEVYKEGDLLKQADLASTYKAIARHGIDWFYRGPFATNVAQWMKSNGGILTAEDFAQYDVRRREPLRTTYRGYEIVGFPPPSSGGVHVAQILNILENFDLRAIGARSPQFVHLGAEAMKLAFVDRAFWLGDPDFTPVPRGLVDKKYATNLARKIDLTKAVDVIRHGEPDDAPTSVFGKHTTHFSAADAEGNWVACTATINTSFGSKCIVPGTGVLLNNEMDDFSIQPGVTNYFGLVGAEANAVAPGKRPLSSMSPTIVLQNGRPILSVGAAGGPTIISQTLLAILQMIDCDADLPAALAAARFHHQWKPNEIRVEKKMGHEIMDNLRARGHVLKVVSEIGAAQGVARPGGTGRFIGAADPRGEGQALGF